jgi:hypothetical protein
VSGCIPIGLCELFTAEWLTAVGTVGAVVLALVLALWGEEIRRLVARPQLSLKTHVGRPDSVSVKRETTAGSSSGTAYFFRLAVRNSGNTAAREVQVFLDSVERVVNGKSEKVAECTPMNLLWSYRRNATLPTLLPKMPPTYCDLVHVEEPQPGWNPLEQRDASLVLDVEFPSNTGGHVLGAGTYFVRIILAGANCRPRRYKLEVVFPGSWFAQEEKMFDVGFKMRAV